MKILDIREKSVKLRADIQNSVVSFDSHDVSLVAILTDRVIDGKPVTGFGFNSIGRFAQGGLMRERFFPRLLAIDADELIDEESRLFAIDRIRKRLMQNEKPGGHGCRASAVSAIELALWDANAKIAGLPAYRLIADTFGTKDLPKSIPVYAAGGYYSFDGDLNSLSEEIASYRDSGYNYFKMKIGGSNLKADVSRVEAAIRGAGAAERLAVDANGRFNLETAIAYGRALEPFGLRWYEEAGDPLDYALNAALAESYSGRLATGENLFSAQDVRNLVRYGGMRPGLDYFQMDPGLSYGLFEYAEMISVLEAAGHDRMQVHPHGGHVIGLHVAMGLGLGGCEAYPGVFEPFGGYPEACGVGDGSVTPTSAPGFGIEEKKGLSEHLAEIVA